MPRVRTVVHRAWGDSWISSALFAAALAAVAVVPTPLVPVARAIHAACERIPVVSAITRHAPPLFLAFLIVLTAGLLIGGGRAGIAGLVATVRFNRQTDRRAGALPGRLAEAGRSLGIVDRLTHLGQPAAMAFCYGLFKPRIAVTAGLLAILDDAELLAVLAHEREHLRRRDPLRYLIIDTVAAATSILPITRALRTRLEAEIELAADRAALAVAPRAALAGALLAVLSPSAPAVPGLAGLSATEARIANLSGQPALPALPRGAVLVTIVLAAMLVAVGTSLALSVQELSATCPRCAGG